MYLSCCLIALQIDRGIDEKLLKNEIEYLKKNLQLKHLLEGTKNLYEDEVCPFSCARSNDLFRGVLLRYARPIFEIKFK